MSFCADPSELTGLSWLWCYLTTIKHMQMYWAVGTVLLLLGVTAPVALLFGFGGATAARSRIAPLRWFGNLYIALVRGIPDIAFFMFFVIALDQGLNGPATESNARTGPMPSVRAMTLSSAPRPSCPSQPVPNGCTRPMVLP